MAITASCQF